jgi:hypothetical protein
MMINQLVYRLRSEHDVTDHMFPVQPAFRLNTVMNTWPDFHKQIILLLLICMFCNLYFAVRRVPPQFSIPPPPVHEVMLGAGLNLTCVAVGSPMPYVKWRKGLATDITPDDKLPIGRNVLELTNIQESANYTCVAASALGVIESMTQVKVQCE